MAKLEDIAARSGMSISQVSRTLNPNPDQYARISQQTRQKILKAAKELDYQPNRAGEFLRRGKSPVIGVFTIEEQIPSVSKFIFGVTKAANEMTFPLSIEFHETHKGDDNFAQITHKGYQNFIRKSQRAQHSGIITAPHFFANPEVTEAIRLYKLNGGAVVLIDSYHEMDGIPVIRIDDIETGRIAARQLMTHSCKKYVILGVPDRPTDTSCYPHRIAGFTEVIAQTRHIPEHIMWSRIDNPLKPTVSDETIQKFIACCISDPSILPVGVFSLCDIYALRFINFLVRTPLKVGHDIFIIGSDNLPIGSELNPPLTSIDIPFKTVGLLAMQTVIDIIYNKEVNIVQTVKPTLVIRDTA